jgi:hypothetical protein
MGSNIPFSGTGTGQSGTADYGLDATTLHSPGYVHVLRFLACRRLVCIRYQKETAEPETINHTKLGGN